jgi:hypothetical protein
MKFMAQSLGLAAMTLLSAMVCACTTIGAERVADWPQLEVREHYVPHAEMRDRCSKYVSFFMSPEACAEFDFAARRCDLWFSADFPPGRHIIEHERQHCLGYEHVGEHGLRELLVQYMAAQSAAGPSASQGSSAALSRSTSAAGR